MMDFALTYYLEAIWLWKTVKNFIKMKPGRKESESSRPVYYRVGLPRTTL